MKLGEVGRRLSKLTIDNSPTILSAVAVGGVVVTVVLTAKAATTAAWEIYNEENGREPRAPMMTPKEKIGLVWRVYIPPAMSGVATVTAIIGANRIGTRRAAAITAAYVISERAFEEYREKIVDKLGDRKEQQARDEIAQARVTANPPSSEIIIMSEEVLCQDAISGRYFKSTVQRLAEVVNELNNRLFHESSISLSEFYYDIGLERTSMSDEIGWNLDKMLSLDISAAVTPDGKPCLVIDFKTQPIRHHYRLS